MQRLLRFTAVAAIAGCFALVLPLVFTPARAQPAVKQGGRIQGTASIDRRDRVVGAVVTVRPEEDPSRLYMTSTDGSGVFQLDGLPNGDYEVTLQRSGFKSVIKGDVGLKYPFRAVVEVTMLRTEDPPAPPRAFDDPGGSAKTVKLEGVTRERDAGPVGEVRVRLVHPTGKRDPRQVESDIDGNFSLDELPAGEWTLAVNAVGFLPLRIRLDVTQDSNLEISMVRQPADYEPSPLELMPPEQPTPPPGFLELEEPGPEEPTTGPADQGSGISPRTAK